MIDEAAEAESAFGFSGSWREYAPVAFTNLLLTIVTLGIYTFWGRARTRRYLWSRTRFIDDRLEWAGTGGELFVGYLLAIVLFVLPLGVLQLLIQGSLMHGHPGAAVLIGLTLYLLLIYLVGVAIFRALRYRLSRTYWHGIRGGSDENGFGYGVQHWWRTTVGSLALGLMVPWSMTTLWNRRWAAMSFGPMRFRATAEWRRVFGRYLIFYLTPTVFFLGALALILIVVGLGMAAGLSGTQPGPGIFVVIAVVAVILYLLFFVVLGIVALIYYAAFFREALGQLTLGTLRFGFTARTRDWIGLYLGNIGLTLVTLGIGYIFVPYRNWTFFVRHAQAYGDVRLDDFTQSATRQPGQGEGMLDAFDVGAFLMTVRVWHYDGRSALRRTPLLVDDGETFRLTEEDGDSGPFRWADLVSPQADAGVDSYRLNGAPGWRIGFPETPPPVLAAKLPAHARYGRWVDRLGLWRASALLACLAAVAVALVLRSPPLVARLVPDSVERRLGDVMVGDFGKRGCATPAGAAALAALVQRVDPDDRNVEVHVVAIPVVNAVTLPGRRIVLFSGLLKQAQSPDEVAGVIGHELGHVAHHDVTEALIRQLGLSVLLGGLEGHVSGYSNALLATAYSRRAEAHADEYAMGLLRDAAVSPAPTAAFFRRMAAKSGGSERMWAYIASHPVSADRATAFALSGQPGAATRPALDTAQWAALQDICRGTSEKFQWRF